MIISLEDLSKKLCNFVLKGGKTEIKFQHSYLGLIGAIKFQQMFIFWKELTLKNCFIYSQDNIQSDMKLHCFLQSATTIMFVH